MGLLIAHPTILLWTVHRIYLLVFVPVSVPSLWMLVHIIVRTYLYTGLFITAHDAMHGQISQNRSRIRRASYLWAMFSCYFFDYHFEHHELPGTLWWQLYRIKNLLQ